MASDHTPNDIIFEEVLGDSRSFTINRQTITKDFVFRVTSDLFVDLAEKHLLPGTSFEMLFDDKVFQQQVLPLFYGMVPLTFMFYIDDDNFQLLYAASLSATQINFTTWELKLTYDIPDDNGANSGSAGAGGGDTGPSDREQNSTKFTQVSFNGSVSTEKIQKAIVKECQKAKNRPAGEAVPYTVGQTGLIGYSEDGIEGAEVYVRAFKFQITQYMPPSKLTYSYIRRLSRMITCVNQKKFFGFAPESVMFIGYSGEGDLYQAVPVTLEFEVKNNFAFDDTFYKLSSPDDEVVWVGDTKVVLTAQQYDRIFEPEFPTTAAATGLGDGNGIHSGWSIVSYEYAPQIMTANNGRQIRKPSLRTIFTHYDPIDFDKFKL